MKPFSENFEILTQRGDVINPKFAWKRAQTRILCTNGDGHVQKKVPFLAKAWYLSSLTFTPLKVWLKQLGDTFRTNG